MPSSTVSSPNRSDASAPEEAASTLLQRVILPRRADPTAVRALYIDERSPTGQRAWASVGGAGSNTLDVEVGLANPNSRQISALSRTSVLVPAQTEVSFAAYFN